MLKNEDRLVQDVRTLVRERRYEDALQLVDEALLNNPGQHGMWRLRGYVCEQKGDAGMAIENLSQAIAMHDMEPHYFYQRGICCFSSGRFSQAIDDFTRVLQLCEHYNSEYYEVPAYFFRAEAYLRSGLYDKALDDCEKVPSDFKTWTDKLRSREEVVAECKQAKRGKRSGSN